MLNAIKKIIIIVAMSLKKELFGAVLDIIFIPSFLLIEICQGDKIKKYYINPKFIVELLTTEEYFKLFKDLQQIFLEVQKFN